jgi:hypothetical protein
MQPFEFKLWKIRIVGWGDMNRGFRIQFPKKQIIVRRLWGNLKVKLVSIDSKL